MKKENTVVFSSRHWNCLHSPSLTLYHGCHASIYTSIPKSKIYETFLSCSLVLLFWSVKPVCQCRYTHWFTLRYTCAVISLFPSVRDYRQTFHFLDYDTSGSYRSLFLSVAAFASSSARLASSKLGKNWNLSLNFVAVASDRVLLLGASKGRSKWTGNYVYGQFEVTSLHIGWSFK